MNSSGRPSAPRCAISSPHCHAIKNTDKAMYSRYMPSPPPVCADSPLRRERHRRHRRRNKALLLLRHVPGLRAPNTGDALAAIKKYVFEEHKVTPGEICAAIAANFEGYEDLQKLLLRGPKFGNNDPYVDSIVNQVLSYVSDVVAETPASTGPSPRWPPRR